MRWGHLGLVVFQICRFRCGSERLATGNRPTCIYTFRETQQRQTVTYLEINLVVANCGLFGHLKPMLLLSSISVPIGPKAGETLTKSRLL